MNKSQAAIEYLVLSTVLILIISIVLWYSLTISSNTSAQIKVSQLQSLVKRLKEVSDILCIEGEPARHSISAYIPSGVVDAGFENYTIFYNIRIDSSIVPVYDVSNCKLNGSLPINEGYYVIVLEAMEGYVNVTF